MARWIKNFDALATTPARADALAMLEAGYDAIETAHVVREHIALAGETLSVRGHAFDLKPYKNIYLVGFGKGACAAVYEVYQILKVQLKKTVVIDRSVLTTCPQEIEAFVGTHPLPSEANVKATQVIVGVAEAASADDLVLVVVAGGGSALLCSTMEECDDNARLFRDFERVGASIREMNIVRRHLSTLKGGQLAKALHPATVIGLVFSDIVGGDPQDVASGPTYRDTTTIDDAKVVLRKYDLDGAYTLNETPKDDALFEKVTNIVLICNEDALAAMANAAREIGYEATIVPEALYASPEEMLARLKRDAAPGKAVFAGGEARFEVPADHGAGGRCQFAALQAVGALDEGEIFIAAASDGRDNSDVAGAIVDHASAKRAERHSLDLATFRARRDTIPVFENIQDEIVTGPTDANVSDWYFLITSRSTKT